MEGPDPVSAFPAAFVPPGDLVYAVGDIHGSIALLDRLLATIVRDAGTIDAATRTLVFVGDYIDRGPDSAGVVERLISGIPEGFRTVCLKGNHEMMMLDYLERPELLDHWLMNGAQETLASYGIDVHDIEQGDVDKAKCRDSLRAAIPETHRDFFSSLRLSETIGDYFFVHAGVRPGAPLDEQRPEDLVWIREEFLNSSATFGKIVVHGHTPVDAPEIRPNRIGIDTKAWLSGRLTALRLYGDTQKFLATGGA
ncbi:MAG: serine/threonine protein phosphatase [Hyphomicrobiales bacterium]|nr:serine/threonine protein phosphatase [Hyphomicrobiales bacterium]